MLAFAAALITTSSSLADGGRINFADYPTRVTSKVQAGKLEKGTKMAFACKSCKTVKPIAEKKTFLSWFAPEEKHDCPGCGGKVTVKHFSAGNGGNATYEEYTHVCTKCGDMSAYTCAGHAS